MSYFLAPSNQFSYIYIQNQCRFIKECIKLIMEINIFHFYNKTQDSRLKSIYLTIFLHFLKLHIINNYINSLFIRSRRLPLRPHVVTGVGATFKETKIHVY